MMASIKQTYSFQIAAAIAAAGASRMRETVTASDGTEAYAYPHAGGMAWGVNAAKTGENLLRGIRRPDGSDIAEG